MYVTHHTSTDAIEFFLFEYFREFTEFNKNKIHIIWFIVLPQDIIRSLQNIQMFITHQQKNNFYYLEFSEFSDSNTVGKTQMR